MENYRLRVKRGEDEVEAEGPMEDVRKDVAHYLAHFETATKSNKPVSKTEVEKPADQKRQTEALRAVFNYDEERELVSLRFPPQGENRLSTALLLILYGYKQFAGREEVPVTVLRPALEQSALSVRRIDQAAEPLERENLAKRTGKAKASRYWLTNLGISKAETEMKRMAEQA